MLGDVPAHAVATNPDGSGERLMPGMLLNRLNPLKGLDDDERKELIAEFRDSARPTATATCASR